MARSGCCGGWRPGLRRVTCENCDEEFPVEDGPICPYCDHDHSEEETDG